MIGYALCFGTFCNGDMTLWPSWLNIGMPFANTFRICPSLSCVLKLSVPMMMTLFLTFHGGCFSSSIKCTFSFSWGGSCAQIDQGNKTECALLGLILLNDFDFRRTRREYEDQHLYLNLYVPSALCCYWITIYPPWLLNFSRILLSH